MAAGSCARRASSQAICGQASMLNSNAVHTQPGAPRSSSTEAIGRAHSTVPSMRIRWMRETNRSAGFRERSAISS